jgi:hypothetical protein
MARITTSLPSAFSLAKTSSTFSGVTTIHSTGLIESGSGGVIFSGVFSTGLDTTSMGLILLPNKSKLAQPARLLSSRDVIRIRQRGALFVDFAW